MRPMHVCGSRGAKSGKNEGNSGQVSGGGGKKEAYRVAGNSPVVGLVAISAGERLEHDGGKSRDADDRIRLGLGSMSTWEGCSG